MTQTEEIREALQQWFLDEVFQLDRFEADYIATILHEKVAPGIERALRTAYAGGWLDSYDEEEYDTDHGVGVGIAILKKESA